MTVRLVLAVALAAALIAAATPAIDSARTTRTERLAERDVDRVAEAATTLATEESPGARRTLAVSLPARSPTAAAVVVAIGGVEGGERVEDSPRRDVLAFSVAGGPRRVRRVGTDLRVSRGGAVAGSDAAALVLRGGETYTVTLRLRRVDGRRTVVVSVERE
ncbi:hypothetical protein M0R88_12545 [Halorussus gelatinilyticus]|uniref:DUF7311 domain-containing protein n=1 Tax=Halorussus gelatinilyticus TaxID=2937524 RepID=A0A8U0IF69_9EURY|nr:hypothetical protein [Halorussus gelatinilyticus]UPV99350.1 hypothetical protein M0R88_12545 [Halorussus gelatinilyticus]